MNSTRKKRSFKTDGLKNKLCGADLFRAVKDEANARGWLGACIDVAGMPKEDVDGGNRICFMCKQGRRHSGNYRVHRSNIDGLRKPFCSKCTEPGDSIVDIVKRGRGVDPYTAACMLADYYGLKYYVPKKYKGSAKPVVAKRAVDFVEPETEPLKQVASDEVCGAVYAAMLDSLTVDSMRATYPHVDVKHLEQHWLSDEHRQNLLARGLSIKYIRARKICSWPSHPLHRLNALKAAKAIDGWDRCPGVSWFEKSLRRDGLIVPTNNLDGASIRLRVRQFGDAAEKYGKYLWCSERNEFNGVAACHVPLYSILGLAPPFTTLRVTEGELKCDAATALSGILTIGVPGHNCWRMAEPIVKALQPKRLLLAFDMDAVTNKYVRESLREMRDFFRAEGFNVKVEEWLDAYRANKSLKGIDDYLLSLNPNLAKGVV